MTARPPSFLQIFSKLFPNFLQIFGGFLQAFPNFCLVVLGNFKGLAGRKFGNPVFAFLQIFCPRRGRNFFRARAAAAEADAGEALNCQTTGNHYIAYFEKQNNSCDFFPQFARLQDECSS
jgi:hypothetical protein